jgi:hypothetical protein
MLINPQNDSKWIPTKELALIYIALCLIWWLQSAASDLKWLTYIEIITPMMCHLLDLIDQIALQIALWRVAAYSLYCTVPYLFQPQMTLNGAY